MIFSSYEFIGVYLPVTLLGFLLAARLGRAAGGLWLVLASFAFYGYWRLSFLPLLLISIAFNFAIGQALAKTQARPRLQNALLIFGLAADLLALFYYKYAAALAAALGFGTIAGTRLADIILPLGISFFTFTQIGYLVDVKQGVAKTRDLLSYVMFVTFFPHLIAGPILHNREMMSQFADPAMYRPSARNLAVGLSIFIFGLAKKVLLADPLSPHVATGFAAAPTAGLTTAWAAVVFYSLQLYFDFSGYSDMAIGLARMFNVRFPLNFNSPFKATTVIDYWQRWHMSLTRFITMYIYSPIALAVTRWRVAHNRDASRAAAATPAGFAALVLLPTLVTMGLAGVWHGAGLQFLIFGLLHGSYIACNHAIRIRFPPRKAAPARGPAALLSHAAKVLAVYLAVLVAFAFFRAPSASAALQLLAGMAGLRGAGPALPWQNLAWLAALLALVWFAPNTQQIMCRFEPFLGKPPAPPGSWPIWRPSLPWALACAGLAAASLLALGGPSEFLYFQF